MLTEWYLISFRWESPGEPRAGSAGCGHSAGRWPRVLARRRKPCCGDGRPGSSEARLSASLDRSSEELGPPPLSDRGAGAGTAGFSPTGGSWRQTDSGTHVSQESVGLTHL